MPRVKNDRRDKTNPLVYVDVAISGGPTATVDLGRVVFELYNDIAPKVQANISDLSQPLTSALPATATAYAASLWGCVIPKCARLQRTSASYVREKQAPVKALDCRFTSKAHRSTGSSKAL